jgi:hypothetical protein
VELNTRILTNIYVLLIRSIFDYSAIISPSISATNLYNLQVIQNNALRLILQKPIDTRITTLHQLSNICLIHDRFNQLSIKFILIAFTIKNPIIEDSYFEYTRFANGRNLSTTTLFCPFKNQIDEFFKTTWFLSFLNFT